MIDGLRRDVIGAFRGLAASPGFAAAAIVTLGLGIGATAAIFTVVKSVLLAPLPYSEPGRRVEIFNRWVSFDKTWLSTQEIVDYRTSARTLADVGAWSTSLQNLTGDGEPLRITVGLVTANLFDVLGARPVVGRVISAEEDRPHGPPVAVIGYPLWQARYAGDPSIVGRILMVDDEPVQVIGVMPQGFRLPTDFTDDAAEPTQLWRALQIDEAQLERGSHGYYAAAVLAPGQTAATATAELQALTRRLTEAGQYPVAMQFSAFAVPLDEEIRGGVRPALWMLTGAVGCLLLIACANVANLLLVRGDARVREMAVRTALGAAPNRLVRQLFMESLVLALCGVGAGVAVAVGALRWLLALNPSSLPALSPLRVDGPALLFTLVAGVATTLLFGLAPAVRSLRVNLVESLREGGQQGTVGASRQRLRGALVVAEVALAVVLVIGAGLMMRSLSALGRIDLGFTPDRLLTMSIALPASRYDTPEKVSGFVRQVNERVRALPGVQTAGFVRALPLATSIGDYGLDVEGFEEGPGRNAKGDWQIVSDGALEALGTRLVRGRVFTPADTPTTQPVAIVNETLARTYWTDPGAVVGGRIRIGSNPSRPWATVVGVVADERHNGVTGRVKEKFYIPHGQWPVVTGGNVVRSGFVVVRTAGDPLAVSGSVQGAIRALDPNLPIANVRPMTEVVAAAIATSRLTGFLMAAFAGVALTLAAVGLYGLLSYLVARRTHEIGIRIAIGAAQFQVVSLVVRQALVLTTAGLVLGLAAAFGLSRTLQGMLYQVRPVDPVTYVAVPVALVAVALAASAWPAARATRISPVVALRSE